MPSYGVGGQGTIRLVRATTAGATFRVTNVFRSSTAKANLEIRCITPRTRLAGSSGATHAHAIAQRMVSRRASLAAGGRRRRVTVGCPPDWTAINGFLDGPRTALVENSTRDSTWRLWEFDVRNTAGGGEASATVTAQCLPDQTGFASGRGIQRHRHLFRSEIEPASFDVPASPTPGETGRAFDGSWSCFK